MKEEMNRKIEEGGCWFELVILKRKLARQLKKESNTMDIRD